MGPALLEPTNEIKYFAKMGWIKVIEAKEPLRNAIKIMVENKIRHLPVVDGGELVGFLSVKDAIDVLDAYNAQDLLKEKVSEFMSENVIAARPEEPLWEVLKVMAEADVGAVPIVDDEGKVLGMFTERDVVLEVAPEIDWGDVEALKFGSTNVKVVEPATTFLDAVELMKEYNIRHLPVVQNKSAIGLVTALGLLDFALKNEKKLGKGLEAEPVRSFMEDFVYVPVEAKFLEALETLARSPNDAVLLLGEDKEVKGIITDRDVLRATAKAVERMVRP